MSITLDGTNGITTPDIASTTSTLGALTQALDLGSTGQIVFPATQNASSNANTLDDYEEGTWTPTMYFGTTLATASTASGRYVKVGGIVTVTGQYALSSKNGGTGYCQLRNFPFPGIYGDQGDRGGAAVGYFTGFGSQYPFLMLGVGDTTASFRKASSTDFDNTEVADGSSVWFSYSYATSS